MDSYTQQQFFKDLEIHLWSISKLCDSLLADVGKINAKRSIGIIRQGEQLTINCSDRLRLIKLTAQKLVNAADFFEATKGLDDE